MTEKTKGAESEFSSRGVGLDLGTMNVVAARRAKEGVQTTRVRNAFLDVPREHKKMLRLANVNYVEKGDDLVIIGDAAYELANVLGREVRRPLQSGLVSAGELDALEILGILVRYVLGEPKTPDEVCYFSVPAAPVDDPDRDVVYHRGVLERVVRECGYRPVASNEAMAIIYAECAKDAFSGIAISFGCLTPDTRILVRQERPEGPVTNLLPVAEIHEGDFVLSRTGAFNRVQKTWVRPHQGDVFRIAFYGNPEGVTLTGNHEVWVQRDGDWSWTRTEDLVEGDIIGEPVVAGRPKRSNLNFSEKTTNAPAEKRHLPWSMGLGRLLGYFLADGHLGPEEQGSVWFDFGPEERAYVDDVIGLVDHYFKRSCSVSAHGNAQRVQFTHKGIWAWFDRRCYGPRYLDDRVNRERRDKTFPLRVEELNDSVIEGIVVGLFRGDGTVNNEKMCTFGNSSTSLVASCHLLLRRMGLTSTITCREPRDTTFKDGRTILAENCKEEWSVHVCGSDGEFLRELIEGSPNDRRAPKVWREGGMVCTKVRSIERLDYEGPVHDLTVEGDPSFCAPGIVLHNSGMANVALAINTIEGLTFSTARSGDWIDHGAAKSVGSTQARMCSVKEKGLNLVRPEGREQEALAVYYKNLIEYTLDNLADKFEEVRSRFSLPKAIPIVVSGGTSKAEGFLQFFAEVFESKRKRFPLEISEIRAAKEPLDSVARGLLVQALQDDEGT